MHMLMFKVAGLLGFMILHWTLLTFLSRNINNNGSDSYKYHLKMKQISRNPENDKVVPRSYMWRSDVMYTFPESVSFLEQHRSGHSSLERLRRTEQQGPTAEPLFGHANVTSHTTAEATHVFLLHLISSFS